MDFCKAWQPTELGFYRRGYETKVVIISKLHFEIIDNESHVLLLELINPVVHYA